MTGIFESKEVIQLLEKITYESDRDHKQLFEIFKKQKNDSSNPNLSIVDVMLMYRMSIAFKMIVILVKYLKIAEPRLKEVTSIIEGLVPVLEEIDAHTNELDNIRRELESAKDAVRDTVLPMKRVYDEAKEREIRGEDIYE